MMELQELFIQYQQGPITPECYKELGKLIKRSSPDEIETSLESIQPNEIHLQLLKLTAARTAGYYRPLLDGLKNECRFVTEFCLRSKILFSNSDSGLLNVDVLLSLLEVASVRTRYCVLSNLGKYLSLKKNTKATVADIDDLYNAVTTLWGPRTSQPLLCQTSREVLEKELPHVGFLPKRHLFVIAKRFPYLALTFLENHSCSRLPEDVVQYIVRHTMPKSLDYLQKGGGSCLSKSTMKIVLRNHLNVVLDAPSKWIYILEPKLVKKLMKPEEFTLFLTKAWVDVQWYSSNMVMSFISMLPSNEVSKIFNKVLENKYNSSVRGSLSYWESNTELLKFLDPSDRSYIAEEHYKKHVSNEWLHFMTTDKSVPLIKSILYIEQDAQERGALIGKLVETALLNDDQNAIVDVCNLVVTRYRNDKGTLTEFFSSSLDFSSLPAEAWNLVYALAKKFFDPDDWQTTSASKLFLAAIKRNGEPALKEYLKMVMGCNYVYSLNPSKIEDLKCELQPICIREVFTVENIKHKEKRSQLTNFFSLITEWSSRSSSLIDDNVKECVLINLQKNENTYVTMQFVTQNLQAFTVEFIENCFKLELNPALMSYLFTKNSPLVTSEETCKRIFDRISLWGVDHYVKFLIKLKRLGYSKVLQQFAIHSEAVLSNPSSIDCKNAIMLLMLAVHTKDFFAIIDPLLSKGNGNSSNDAGDDKQMLDYDPLESSKQIESIYYGIGLSLSHVELPMMAVDSLSKFCVSGDLIIFVRGALYSICRYLPHEAAKKLLFTLIEQPVSVKKHGIRLMRLVCNIETQRDMFIKLIDCEKHMSIRIILMQNVLACLNDTKSVSFWEVLRKMLLEITSDDKVIVTELLNKSIPDQFLEEYFKILIEKIKLLKAVKHNDILIKVFNKVRDNVQNVSVNYIEMVINEFFLSDRFFDDKGPHGSIVEIVIDYLKGTPIFESMDQSVSKHDRTLTRCQTFMKEKLSACGIGSSKDIVVPVTCNGMYPVRRLLMSFVKKFSRCCLETGSEVPSTNSLHEHVDFFLDYFKLFNQNAVYYPIIFLSLTKILISNQESDFVTGQKIGEFCDLVALNDASVLYYYNFPMAADNFFSNICFHLKMSEESHQLLDMLTGIIDSTPSTASVSSHQELFRMLRLMTVGHILSSQSEDEYTAFRKMFFALIKNTPVEVYLLNK